MGLMLTVKIMSALITGNIVHSAKRRYLSCSEGNFEVFRPQGQHVAPMGVKFGTDKWTFLHAKFRSTPLCQISLPSMQRQGPQTWKFYWNFTKCRNINTPQVRIPCATFTKSAEFVPCFSALAVKKYGRICSRGYGVMEVLSWGGRVSPNFQRPQVVKLCIGPFRSARTCLRSSITMPSLVALRFQQPPGRPKTLFFCLFVRHAFERQSMCARFRHEGIRVQKWFWYRWLGTVCSCA